MLGLEFGKTATNLGATVTPTDKEYSMLVARTDGTVTYTEEYENETTTFTGEEMVAGQVLYGKFTAITTTGHIVAYR